VALQPRSEFARRNLGNALASLGRIDDARAAFRAAIEINPRWAPAWLRLADLADDDERTAILRQAVDAGVDSVTVLLRLAEAELDEDPSAALADCRRIVELAPLAAEGALCLGKAYLAVGDPLKGTPHLRRATVLGRGTTVGDDAKRLLAELASGPR
jgi:tetratricopeptide (TPR) repeat protein